MIRRETCVRRSLRRALFTAAGLAALTGPAWAQDADEASVETTQLAQAPAPESIETLVVTARRREETLLEVPIAITTFDGARLDQLGAIDITALNEVVPNVTIELSRNTASTLTPFIRGVGQQDPVAGFEQGVGLYIDDVVLNRPQGGTLDLFDVERVEVLRGPQGTLYGRNTIGGAIKYVTRRLGDERRASVRLAGGSFGQFDGTGTFALPITDDLAVGGSIAFFRRNGFGENLFLGIDNGDRDTLGGRLSVEWTPTERIFVRIAGDWIDDDSEITQGSRLIPSAFSINPETGLPFPVLDNVFDTFAGLTEPEANTVNRGVSGTIQIDLTDKIQVKSITAYRDNFSFVPEDFDSLPNADVDVPVEFRDDQFTQEIQLSYSSARFNGLVGFFYINANAFNQFDVILDTLGTVIGLPGFNAFTLGDVDTESWAIFGDWTYDITDSLSFSFGGRFTVDERTALVQGQTFIGGLSPAFGGTATLIGTATNFVGNETFREFTPRVSLSWFPTPNHNLYASYSEGFKGGGFDPSGDASVVPDLNGDGITGVQPDGTPNDPEDVSDFFLFEPEEIRTWEVGYKSTLFGGRVNQATSFFFSDYNNVQIPGSQGVDADGDGTFESFVGITSNAADARIFGVEFEGDADIASDILRNGDNLRTTWGLGYINAEFNTFINAFGDDIADIATFQNTPAYTFSSTFDYSTPLNLFGRGGIFTLTPAISYRSTTNQFEISTAALDQPGYVIFNSSVQWTTNDGRVTLAVNGRNLTNTEFIVSGFDFVDDATFAPELGLDGTLTAFFGDPRTVTGSITVNF
ncbi:MAG: TonB-dependent receptor [Maricaulaceae bacterium]